MNKTKTLIDNYELIHKEIKRQPKYQKEREQIEKSISLLQNKTDVKEIIHKNEETFIQPLLNLLTHSNHLDLLLVNLIHIMMIQELIPLYYYDQLLLKFQNMKRNEIINIKTIQIISSIMTNSLVSSLPANTIYNGLKLLAFMSTTPLVVTSVHSIFTFISTTAAALLPPVEKIIPKEFITLKEANRLIDTNENYCHQQLIESTQPLIIGLSKFLNDLCISPEFTSIKENNYQLIYPILSHCSNLFYQVKSLYSLLLQILIPQLPIISKQTMEYHQLMISQYCTFPGYPQSLVDSMKESDQNVLLLFYNFFSSNHSSFIITKHFEPMILYFLQNCALIAIPSSFENISSPQNLNQMAFFCYYLFISHLFTIQTESSPIVVDLTLSIIYRFEVSEHLLVCIEKLLRIVIVNNRSIVELVGIANKIQGGWNAVINIMTELSDKIKKEEWKSIWNYMSNNHWRSIAKITPQFNDEVFVVMMNELVPFLSNTKYFSELFLIYQLNIKRLPLFHDIFVKEIKKAFFEDTSLASDIIRMIDECLQKVIGLLDNEANENEDINELKNIQNKSLSILLNFIIELLQDNNCLTIYHTSFLECLESIVNDSLDFNAHISEIQTLFTFFSKSNKNVVMKSFTIVKELLELIHPKYIPLDLIQQYVKQQHDINITLSSIQLYADLMIQLSTDEESLDIYLKLLKQIYLCLKDERYDIWSCSLQTIIQACACKGELIQLEVDEFLTTILFPLLKEMKRIYFRLTNTEIPQNKMSINLYLPLTLRQWNDNVCVLVGGLTRVLKYILPYVSEMNKMEMYDNFIELIQISLCNGGLLICEVIMKYINALLQYTINEKEVFERIVTTFISIGNIIQEANGVNGTISENYLLTTKKIIENQKVESIIYTAIRYVNVFPDDFAIHSSGLSLLHQFIFELLDYTLEHYENSESLYINCLCSLLPMLIGQYQQRATSCINKCFVECFKKLSKIITIDNIKQIDLEQLIQALNSSRELLIQICSLDNDFYSQVIESLNEIVFTIGMSGNEKYCELFYEVYSLIDKEQLNTKLYQQYDKAYEYLHQIIIENKQSSQNEYIISRCLLSLKWNGFYDNVIPLKEKIILSLIEEDHNQLGNYTQTQLIIHLIDELEFNKTLIEDCNDENNYLVKQCVNYLQLIAQLIQLNKYNLDKKSLYVLTVQFISSQYVSIRKSVVEILSLLNTFMTFN